VFNALVFEDDYNVIIFNVIVVYHCYRHRNAIINAIIIDEHYNIIISIGNVAHFQKKNPEK